MKSTGIVRKIDELGRLVLPIELRRVLEISQGTPIEIFTENEAIILRKYQVTCVFCGASDGVSEFKGKMVCRKCRQELIKTN